MLKDLHSLYSTGVRSDPRATRYCIVSSHVLAHAFAFLILQSPAARLPTISHNTSRHVPVLAVRLALACAAIRAQRCKALPELVAALFRTCELPRACAQRKSRRSHHRTSRVLPYASGVQGVRRMPLVLSSRMASPGTTRTRGRMVVSAGFAWPGRLEDLYVFTVDKCK